MQKPREPRQFEITMSISSKFHRHWVTLLIIPLSIRANQQAETLQAQHALLQQQRDELLAKLGQYEDRELKQQAALTNLQCALEQFQNGKRTHTIYSTWRWWLIRVVVFRQGSWHRNGHAEDSPRDAGPVGPTGSAPAGDERPAAAAGGGQSRIASCSPTLGSTGGWTADDRRVAWWR